MTQTPEEKIAELEAQLAEWKELAVETSIRADQAQSLATAATAHLVAGKTEKPPAAAPPPPPVPAAPPPPPAPRWNVYVKMSAAEKAHVKQVHGANVEDVMYEAWDRGNAVRNAWTGGETSHRIVKLGDVAFPAPHNQATYDAGGYAAGAPSSRRIPESAPGKPTTPAEFAQARCDSLNQGIVDGARRPAWKSIFLPPSPPPVQKPARAAPRAGGFFAAGHTSRHE